MEGKYTSGMIKSGTTNFNIEGNEIESVPRVISRNGWTIQYKKLSLSALMSYTSRSFADPLNTEVPSANGAVGIVPAYTLLDMNASYKVSNHLTIKSSLT